MGKRTKKKRRSRADQVNPQVFQILQRRLGRRQKDPAEVARVLEQETRQALERGDYNLAIDLGQQAKRVKDKAVREASRRLLAEAHFRRASTHDGPARLKDLNQAIDLVPQDPRYRFHLALALHRSGQVNLALEHYAALARQDGHLPGLGFLWSVAALEAGQPLPDVTLTPAERQTLDMARALSSQKQVTIDPQTATVGDMAALWQALARMVADPEATPMEALQSAARALKDPDTIGVVHYYLGVVALRAGDANTARKAWAKAREAGYQSPWLEKNLGHLYRQQVIDLAEQGDWQAIVDVGEPALRAVEDRILAQMVGLAFFHLGYQAAQAGDWQTARQHWQRAEQYDSNRYLAQNLALALEQQEDWAGAAEAWRDMLRRRPRTPDHADYLDDNQMAGLWRHAAECYTRADDPANAIACLQNGLKYTKDDLEMRLELALAFLANEQYEASENELRRILKLDPDNVDALLNLGLLYEVVGRRGGQIVNVLKRALELAPDREDIRETLASHFIRQGNRYMEWGRFDLAAQQFRQGIEQMPDYGMLYAYQGTAEYRQGNAEAARSCLLQAYELEPDRAQTVGYVLHELLHLKATPDIERLLPRIREMTGLLPRFWIHQGERVLECKLDKRWVERFFEEALALVGKEWVSESRAEVLADIVLELFALGPDATRLIRRYRKRINQEVPQSGASEYIDGLMAVLEQANFRKAERLLGKAHRKARKAHEEGLRERIEEAQAGIRAGPFELLDRLFS